MHLLGAGHFPVATGENPVPSSDGKSELEQSELRLEAALLLPKSALQRSLQSITAYVQESKENSDYFNQKCELLDQISKGDNCNAGDEKYPR